MELYFFIFSCNTFATECNPKKDVYKRQQGNNHILNKEQAEAVSKEWQNITSNLHKTKR